MKTGLIGPNLISRAWMKIARYGVYWTNLDPVIGSEISKTRPVVIVSDMR